MPTTASSVPDETSTEQPASRPEPLRGQHAERAEDDRRDAARDEQLGAEAGRMGGAGAEGERGDAQHRRRRRPCS